jgi:sterol desaturase/sphingolipid hydroxylase (fatty acid hydroxylase superfamily)
MLDLLIGFGLVFFLFVPLERAFALRPGQRVFRRGFGTDLAHFLANRFLVEAAVVAGVVAVAVLLRPLVSADLRGAVALQPGWLQFLEAVLVADVALYWAHRWSHTVPFLWRFHAVHHSSERLDWLASARLHPLDQAFHRSVAVAPLWLLGFTRETFGAYLVVATLQGIFLHANVRLRFGPLRWLVATPEFHHWHHANDAEARDKNFAGQLPLLDALFGTLHMPAGRMPATYGIDRPLPSGYLGHLAAPFRRRRAAIPGSASP